MKRYSLLLLALILIACEEEIEYEIPDPGARIVIDGSLENGRRASFFISESVYSMSNDIPATRNDFNVALKSNDTNALIILQPFEISDFEPRWVYNSFELIEADKTYHLVVNDSVLPEAEVMVRVPLEPILRSTSYDKDSRDVDFEIRDNGEQRNFYMLTVEKLNGDRLYFSTLDAIMEFLEFDIFIGDEFDGRYFGDRCFFTDEVFDGKTRKFNIRVDEFNQLQSGETFNLRVHNISESFYRHEITKAAYFSSDGFFSEPVQIHSNIEGGYGIVRASSSSIQSFRF